jgi:type I restriction enzyme S subunit
MRPVLKEIDPHMNYWLNSSEHCQRYFERLLYGQGRPHLSFEQILATPIALPPLKECHQIVQEVDRQLSGLNRFRREVDESEKRYDRLRQAILSF